MSSRFDNSIYWIISHVLTTIRYYTYNIAVSVTHKQSTTELPWTSSDENLQVQVIFRLTVSQSVSLGVMTRYLLLLNVMVLFLGRFDKNLSKQSFLYRLGMDNTENTASIVDETCSLLVAQQRKTFFLLLAKNFSSREMCLPSRILATDIHVKYILQS
jgi:hypothetical protein